jgi:hypothetical protein
MTSFLSILLLAALCMSVLVMGCVRALAEASLSSARAPMPLKEWLWELGVIYLAYLVLYYSAGYFIAWQNPEVPAFYGSLGCSAFPPANGEHLS